MMMMMMIQTILTMQMLAAADLEQAVQLAMRDGSSADADCDATAEFAKGLLRYMMLEAQDHPSPS